MTLPPVATRGPEISLRVSRHRAPELIWLDLADPDRVIPLVVAAVEQRHTLLISGATGTGKTTLLGAAMACATPVERLVVLEEVQEITLNHPHVVSLECRQANLEGAGEITLTRLVRESLRMRPSRLIIGEIRGAEIADVLQAFHTGHPGGGATLHASSLHEVPARLEGLGALAAADVSRGVTPGEPCSLAREILVQAGATMVLCDEHEQSVVVQGRLSRGIHTALATARAGVADSGEK